MLRVVKNDEALDVLEVGLLCAPAEMPETRSDSHLIQELGRSHTGSKLAGWNFG